MIIATAIKIESLKSLNQTNIANDVIIANIRPLKKPSKNSLVIIFFYIT